MQIDLLRLKHFKKASFASLIVIPLILMFLMAMLPFSTAIDSASTMYAPFLTVTPTVDGNWSSGEWADAPQCTMTNSTGANIGYIRAKFNSSHLLVIIDSPWDTTPSTVYYHENVWLAFDTLNNGGTAPQSDDYLVHPTTSWFNTGWVGNGTAWTVTLMSGVSAAQAGENKGDVPLGTSPNSAIPHRISEMAVPLAYVGSAGSTVGFYAQVDDDSTDPDGTGTQPATAYSEWPPAAGGSPGWPGASGSAPCPAPNAWGNLKLVQRPVADFTFSPPAPDVGDVVTFNATASYDLDGTIANYTWVWGDTSSNVTTNPITTHTFSTAGSYDVNLTVTDNDGLKALDVHTVNVGVVAAFTFSPPSPNPGDVVTFNATASYDLDGTIANYTWVWGDTSSNVTTNPITTHTFSKGGSYAVNLTVTDNFTRMAWVVHTVNVGVPVANFTFWPSQPNAGDAVIFDATASYDPDGIANYTWVWGDTSSNVTTNPITTHTFSTAGSYDVNLTVTDNIGLKDSIVDTVTVYARREAQFSFSPSTPNAGDVVTFDASLSKDPGGNITNYTWDFDDGNTTTVNTTVINHTFSANGSYNVNLTITDNDGLKSWYSNTVNVGISPFQATAPFSPMIPTIDGVWSSGEWTDSNEYIIKGAGGEGYMMVKWGPGNITGDFLYILIDSVWDTTNATVGFENVFVAFDTEQDKSTVGPQPDDYLFNDGFSQWQFAWKGNGTAWTALRKTEIDYTRIGYIATRWSGSSPKSTTMHRIDELRIPTEFVGNSTVGFYIQVVDGNSDPDGWGPNLPPTAWVEWPPRTGGDPRGWPVPPDYIDPCPTPDKWGHLILEAPKKALSNITLDISSSSITLGESVTMSGTVFNSTGPIAGVDVTIQHKLTGAATWTNATTVTTDPTGTYTSSWEPAKAGTYEIKAVWAGDAANYGAESEVKTLEVASREPIPILVIVAVLAVVAGVAAIAVYLLKVRKP